MVLRRIFGPKGDWTKLHNKRLHILYDSPDIIRMIRSRKMGKAYSTYGKEEERTGF
jgi:hypothetical protein